MKTEKHSAPPVVPPPDMYSITDLTYEEANAIRQSLYMMRDRTDHYGNNHAPIARKLHRELYRVMTGVEYRSS